MNKWIFTLITLIVSSTLYSFAQDDIYFVPSKKKVTKQELPVYESTEYDSWAENREGVMDVDSYNRRGGATARQQTYDYDAVDDSESLTNRIVRFHAPGITVVSSPPVLLVRIRMALQLVQFLVGKPLLLEFLLLRPVVGMAQPLSPHLPPWSPPRMVSFIRRSSSPLLPLTHRASPSCNYQPRIPPQHRAWHTSIGRTTPQSKPWQCFNQPW